MTRDAFDVVLVGAGPAGAACALHLARAGLRCALVDARPLDQAGAQWVNGVPPWMFDRAGLDRPTPPEVRADGGAFVMASPSGARCSVSPAPVQAVDMRLLGQRLRQQAASQGVHLLPEHRVTDLRCEGDRPVALTCMGPEGARTLAAALFIDAAGFKGVLRRRVPALHAICPPPGPDDLCSAAQSVCEINDLGGARAFLEAHEIKAGDTLARVGAFGGFSTTNVMVSADESHVELLTGSLVGQGGVASGQPDGPRLLQQLRAQHPWIGRPLFGGAGVIPLRRPYDRPSMPGIILLGDAGCQVFSAHGSGIGVGLIAARLIASAVAGHTDPGGLEATWAAATVIQRDLGGLLAGWDALRRLSQQLDPDEVDTLIRVGLIEAQGQQAALDQRLPPTGAGSLARTALNALKAPRLAARLGPVAARMPLIHAWYRRYPARPDEAALQRWAQRAAWLVG